MVIEVTVGKCDRPTIRTLNDGLDHEFMWKVPGYFSKTTRRPPYSIGSPPVLAARYWKDKSSPQECMSFWGIKEGGMGGQENKYRPLLCAEYVMNE